MTLSPEVFFGIPELVAQLLSFLERQDLSRLMRTSRFMYTTIAPQLFRDIDLRAIPDRRLAYTQNGLTALARNAHLVKGIRMDGKFFEHYYNCLVTAAASEQLQGASTGAGTRAGIGPPATGTSTFVDRRFPLAATAANSLELVNFPRMNNLSRFDYNLPPPGGDWHDAKVLYADESHLVLSKFSLMIPPAQASRLVCLTLNGPMIKRQRDLNFLAQTVAGLTAIQTLGLGIDYEEEFTNELLPRIFFRLPSSIQVFVFRAINVGSTGSPHWEGQDDATPTAQEAYRRDGPLHKLKEWDVCVDYLMDNPEPYFLMLPYCPELEMVMVPQMRNRDDEKTLAQFIVSQCPKLRRLSLMKLGFDISSDNENDDDYENDLMEPYIGNYDGVLMRLTSQAMLEDTLEAFYYDGFYEKGNMRRARLTSMLSAQFLSLREVHLRRTRSLCGYSITHLLHFAPLLESLFIDGTDEWDSYGIKLQHLSDVSWASSRLRELRVVVDLGYLSEMQFMATLRPFSLSSTFVDKMAVSLGGLVANIGKQTNLHVLDLRVALPPHVAYPYGHRWTYRDEIFPGLLSLSYRPGQGRGHGSHLRRGFLDMLGGLSKLEELRGSVNLIPRDAYGYTTGREEAEWMKEHWPNLRVAEFYPTQAKRAYHAAAEFVRLQEQLPGLIYSEGNIY